MKTTFYKSLKAFTLCAGFFSLAACKEKSIIRPDLIPGVDSINIFQVDTLSMVIKNTYQDSLWTGDPEYPLVGVGRIADDAFFGKTTQGIYLQFSTPTEGFSFPAGTTIDSTVLSVPYLGYAYGDTSRTNPSHVMHLKAYRITDPFALGDGTKKYYSFNKLAHGGTQLGSKEVSVKSLTDTFALSSGDTVANLLRMRLDPEMDNIFATIGAGDLSTSAAFLEFFKGIYLAPDTTKAQNTVAYFALTGGNLLAGYSNAQIEVYYHTSTTAGQRAFFKFNPATCSFFNGIYRNYNGFPVLSYLNNQAASRDSLVIQGYPGFRSDVAIQLNNSIPVSVINKASLIVTVLKTGDETRFAAPAKLLVRVVDSNGSERIVADMANSDGSINTVGQIFVDGSPVTVTIAGQQYTQYTLNMPREVQNAIAAGKTELKLRLSSSITYPGAFRMLAEGPNGAAATRLRFNMIYTKLNQ